MVKGQMSKGPGGGRQGVEVFLRPTRWTMHVKVFREGVEA